MPQVFSGQTLQGRSFRGQDLTGADFSNADIQGADFTNALLIGADFSRTRAGLPRRWAFGLLLALAIVGMLTVFIAGVVATFTGAALIPEDKFRGISYVGLLNPLVLAGFFILVARKGLAVAMGAIAFIAAGGFLALVFSGNLVGAVAVAGDALWMVVLAVAGTAIFTATISITEDRRWVVAGAGVSAWAASVLVVGIVASPLTADKENIISIFRGVGMAAILGVGLSLYMSYRALAGTPQLAWIWKIAFALSAVGGTSFRGANLTDANFTQASLNSTDFRRATLMRTGWLEAKKLNRARCEGTYLDDPQVQHLVTTGGGEDANLDGKNLQGVNLKGANLAAASLIGANLNEAALCHANLSRAKLVQAQLYRADLTDVCLTGAYIQDWGISPETKLEAVKCEYIYLRLPTQDDPDPSRKPDNRLETFKEGEFADFIAPIIKLLDLYHHQNIDPRAVAQTFKTLDLYYDEAVDPSAATVALKQLAQNHPEAGLELVSLEGKGEDKIRLQAKVTGEVDRSQLSAEYFAKYSEIKLLPNREIQTLLAGIAEKDERIRSLENMVVTAIKSQKFYAETYYNLGDTMPENQGSINISGVQGNVSGVAAAGQNQTLTGVALGQINGTVTNTIGQLQASDTSESAQLADLLKQLQEAIAAETNLTPEDKAEALEQVKVLAEAGQKPKESAMQSASKTALKILKGTVAGLPTAAAFVEACDKLLPLIAKILLLV